MKIISWNVRGLGSKTKRGVIKDLVKKENPDIIVFQETKKETIDWKVIAGIWGVRFKEWVWLPAIGRSGGILIAWDVRAVTKIESVVGSFTISVKFQMSQGDDWWLSGVYGPCRKAERKEFWEELANLYDLCGNKWVLGGDFNMVRLFSEKLNATRNIRSMRDFDKFIRDAELRDTPLSNSLYTWSNFRENLVCSRLDRFLFSCEWGDLYPQVRQEALVRVVSDHCPILLDTNPIKWGPTPFRFENMWLEHRDFKHKFKNWWEEVEAQGWEGYKFMSKLQGVKNKVKEWNKEAFGDIRLEKCAILKRVKTLDELEGRSELSDQLSEERRGLKVRLEDLIKKEEISWNQKVKVKWVKEWDNNTKLFHRIASGRRLNKVLNKIELENGDLLEGKDDIVGEVVNFFRNLYSRKAGPRYRVEGLNLCPLEVTNANWLERPFSEEEI